tara:strand:+ start:3941 stop:4255 length:315 start_codon:yes stop_codon:yes gene_type:complete
MVGTGLSNTPSIGECFLSASSIDGHGRSDQSLTLRALKTYENHGPTFHFLCISIVLTYEQKFRLLFPAKFVEKRIAQMMSLDGAFNESFFLNAELDAMVDVVTA